MALRSPSKSPASSLSSLTNPNVSTAFQNGVKDAVDFSVQLLENMQVAVVPGVAFGTKEHVRISYAASMENLEKALDRIEEFMTKRG